MDTSKLKRFAQFARRSLIEQVTSRLNLVLQSESMARREYGEAIADLEKEIKSSSKEQVIDRVAYVWFNRFCALRFMDVNRYTKIGVLSPAEGQFQPEILAEAKMGHIDEDLVADAVVRDRIFALLNGTSPSPDPQTEAYRSLIVSVCNHFYKAMPYLFDRIANYTELLMPDDLLSGNSILAYTREAMTPDVCKDVEAIGWLYQFYISEKKDEVFDGLKKNRKITPENIPAATQLFTPNWIVRYLVENSLGRLWMLNHPNSRLVERMEYYVGSGEWGVGSGESGELVVKSENLVVKSGEWQGGESGKSGEWEGQELQGVDCLAEGDGFGGTGVSGDQVVSEGGGLWVDESGQTGGGVDSVQYRGGTGEKFDGAVQEFSVDRSGIEGRGRDADHHRSTAGLHITSRSQSNPKSIRRNQTHDPLPSSQTPLTPQNSPLPTPHFSLSNTSHSPLPHFPLLTSPEDIKICDPACGSGHMLVYAFDLLYAIYEEEGYEPAAIPEKILTLNLFGIEIDERAGELAAFALTMKARAKHRRFFNKGIEPNICVLENVSFADDDVQGYMDFVGRDLFTAPLLRTLHEFEESNNFGSLIRPTVTDVAGMVEVLRSKNVEGSLFFYRTHEKVLRVLRQADFLSSKYHVVIANPPYMGGKGMNNRMSAWGKDNYPDSKSDLFAMFMERNLELAQKNGYSAMVTMEVWMFLSSYEKLRIKLLNVSTMISMVHMPYLGKGGTSMGINFGTSATIFHNASDPKFKGHFCYVRYFETDDNGVPKEFPVKNERLGYASADDFKKIPSGAIAYWVSKRVLDIFATSDKLESLASPRQGLATADNDRFIKLWFEVAHSNIGFGLQNRKEAQDSKRKWFPYNKGGEFRKWYGNQEYVVNWENDGKEIEDFKPRAVIRNPNYYFQECITWSFISSSAFGVRFSPKGFVFDVGGSSLFTEKKNLIFLTTLLCSKITFDFMKVMNPTLNFQVGNVASIPIVENKNLLVDNIGSQIIDLSREDWDSYETSWDFKNFPLLQPDHHRQSTLEAAYKQLLQHWQQTTLEMQHLEEENNRIFIYAYGLQEEMSPEVPLKEITLTCNPHYRYDSNKSEAELETLLLADTMREFISYAVGCMFGRYSIDKEGLILANQGEGVEDYLRKVRSEKWEVKSEEIQVGSEKWKVESEKTLPTPHSPLPTPHSLLPTPTNVIPILEGDWFTDDISEQFRKFLRLTFGEENYQTNLTFIEKALDKPIQKYFLKDFYNDHVKRYKKRPIYWLFSSPRGSFNALIYLHRYRPDTASIVLNDYLREYRAKLTAHKTHLEAVSIDQNATQSEKTKALKTIENLRKIIDELEKYERDILYPLASQQLAIDLDDGVKINYVKFGAALKKIAGLDTAED